MKTLNVISTFVLSIFLISCDTSSQVTENEDLITSIKESFVSPPESARPWVYWFWVNSNLTRDGITADLEAMKRVGIGGALIMDVSQGVPSGKIKYMDNQWQEMAQFAIQEAARLGLEITMNNDAGWSGSGGPWVEPEYAMQLVVSTETLVTGGSDVIIDLPQPPANGDYYRDIAVLAVQDSELRMTKMTDTNPSLSILKNQKADRMSLPSEQKPLALSIQGKDSFASIDIKFRTPFTACVLDLTAPELKGKYQASLQVSNDGQAFKSIKTFDLKNGKNSIVFDLNNALWFRIKLLKLDDKNEEVIISKLELHNRFEPDNLEMKLWNTHYEFGKKFHGIYLYSFNSAPLDDQAPEGVAIPKEKVIDITKHMDADGHLQWDAPEGQWAILRYGHTYSGAINPPSAAGGEGPECDKLSKEGIRRHFENGMMKKLVELAGPDVGKTLSTFHIDSWEVNGQNWTLNMREEFRKRRGYDIVLFLPAFDGRVIGNLQITERFMWDLRKTVSELIIENYVEEMQKICHENGMKLSFECYTTPANDLNAANYIDEPIAEVWSGGGFSATTKSMASAAHINNRNIVGAEVFTSGWNEKWLLHPASVKANGDKAFCKGVNKFIFHRYAMQPYLNVKPGATMGPWGLHYERTQTWWEYTKPWHTYLARCQYLLRQGKFVADVLNLQPEEPGYWFEELELSGYDYNACSPDAFLKVKMEDGKLVDGVGSEYKLLVLTHLGTMTVPLLTQIRNLVLQGASILGDPPLATPGLSGYPDSDIQIKELVTEIWGTEHTANVDRIVGKGRVFRGITPEEALAKIEIASDFKSDAGLTYIHRTISNNDVYFVANSADSSLVSNCTFRANGKSPHWWNPETGQMKALPVYAANEDGTITIPLMLDPSGSGFVVFSPPQDTDPDRVVNVTHNDKILIQNGIATNVLKMSTNETGTFDFLNSETSISGDYIIKKEKGNENTVSITSRIEPLEVTGSWTIAFPKESSAPEELNIDKLESWTELPEKEVNYFSGTASYLKTLNIPGNLIDKSDKLILDLGEVEVMAKIFVNGEEVGICWRPPYRIDITDFVNQGENSLRIDVVNLWVNRLIGDEFLPEDSERIPFTLYGKLPYDNGLLGVWPDWVLAGGKSPTGRQSFTTWRLWNKDDPLQKSGLMGPVTLQQTKSIGY